MPATHAGVRSARRPSAGRRASALLPALALVALTSVRALSAPPWPDDWDGIGFVQSVTRFDLDRFSPHTPGYPVYVALLRLAALAPCTPIAAANAVAVVTGVAAIAFLVAAISRAFGATAAWTAGAVVASCPLVWRVSSGVGSEAPAFAFAAMALFGATRSARDAPWWIGAAIGLGLGVRLSWAPLFLAFLFLAPSGGRSKAALAALLSTLAWAVPFLAIVGPFHLAALARAHATGHFEVWGGTVIREPGPRRLVWLARDLFVDGIGVDGDPLGVAIGVVAAVLAALGLHAWWKSGTPLRAAALFPLPYLLWIGVGQNLQQQPRHALPIVVFLALGLALAANVSKLARALSATLLALLAFRTFLDARARLTIAPPGEQLVAFAVSSPVPTAVYGGPSARFFELDGDPMGRAAATLGDVRLAVGHLRTLPRRVLVTSELEGVATSAYPLSHIATFCRPPRIDRRAPCLDVFDWQAPFLRR